MVALLPLPIRPDELIKPEARRVSYWTKVSTDTLVSVAMRTTFMPLGLATHATAQLIHTHYPQKLSIAMRKQPRDAHRNL